MTYLLDTCIFSILRKIKTHPNQALEKWLSQHDDHQFYLSALTIGEIQQGISKLNKPEQKGILENWLHGELIPRYETRILAIDHQVASTWGDLSCRYLNRGVSIPLADALIAATAVTHKLIVVTENIKNFQPIKEVKVFSPWSVV